MATRSSIGTSQPLSMRWDTTNDRMLVLSDHGLYSVAVGANVTTLWSRNSIENPEFLFGTTGSITWMLAHDDTNPNTRYLAKVTAPGELTTAHSGGIPMNIGTEPQGLALPDGRLLIVHDPIDGASAWIASADGSLTPVGRANRAARSRRCSRSVRMDSCSRRAPPGWPRSIPRREWSAHSACSTAGPSSG